MAPKLLCFKYYVNYIMLTNFAKNTGLLQAGVLFFIASIHAGRSVSAGLLPEL